MEKTTFNPQSGIDDLILKYVDGRITEKELAELEAWLKEKEDNLKYYRQFRNMLEHNIPSNINSGNALEKVLGRISEPGKTRNWLVSLQRVAAVLFIPLALSFMLFFIFHEIKNKQEENRYTTITAAFGTTSSFELQDGSKVWLNTGSRLQVPERFTKNHREVRLSGEAYFEVKSDPSSPFLVEAGNFTVEATGTRFNVMAYPGDKPSVTLAEGKVMVSILKNGHENVRIPLTPGEHLAADPDNPVKSLESGDVYKYYAWKDGVLVFRNDLLSDIIRRISLQFNVDIETQDTCILQNRYRATFDHESLTEVLDLLKLASPFSYKEIQLVSLPDGTYSKRKIIITSAKPKLKSN
jgi:transmembrane sensor